MKISLFQIVFMAVFGISAMIGLYVFATHTSNNTNKSTDIGTVIIWGTLPKADMQNALTVLRETNQVLKDVSYVQKSKATLTADLTSAIATGEAPDLVLASQEELLSLQKFIMPIPASTLPASTFTSTFIKEGDLFALADGSGYYGLPFLVDPLVLYSNRSILSSGGIAKPPTTWEALTGLVPHVAVITPAKQITRGLIALGTYGNVHSARAILSSIFLQAGVPMSGYANGSLVANLSGSGTNNSSPGQATLSFYTQFADPSKVSYTWNTSLPDSQQAFQNGDLALYLGFASEARYFATANPNLDYTVTPLPQPATATTKSAYALLYAFMIPRGAKNSSGAYQVAALLTNSAEQTTAASYTGLAPATLNLLGTKQNDPVAEVAYAEALYARGWLSPAPLDTDQVFSNMITSVVTGRSNVETTLSSGESALSALLQK